MQHQEAWGSSARGEDYMLYGCLVEVSHRTPGWMLGMGLTMRTVVVLVGCSAYCMHQTGISGTFS